MERARKKRSVFSMGGLFSVEVDKEKHDKAIRFAMFNGIAILLVVVSCVVAYGVYIMLQPFVKPLIWALLCGSALHPFKQSLTAYFKSLIITLESPNKSHGNIIFLPIMHIIQFSDFIGDIIFWHKDQIMKIMGALCSIYFFYSYTPRFVILSFHFIFNFSSTLLVFTVNLFSSILMTAAVVLGYFMALIFLWYPDRTSIFSVFSISVWVAMTAFLSNSIPQFRIPLFVFLQFSLISGYLYNSFASQIETTQEEIEEKVIIEPNRKAQETEKISNSNSSVTYIKWLGYACLSVFLVKLPSFYYVCLCLLTIYFIKHFCRIFGVTETIFMYTSIFKNSVNEWCSARKEVLQPAPVRNALNMFGHVWEKTLSVINTYCDSAASISVILGLILILCFGSIFLCVQVYKESIYFAQTGGTIINRTVVHNPELHGLLPEGWESTMDTALNNSYIYVREALANFIRGFLTSKGVGEPKASELERGALELWDRVYQAWVVPLGAPTDPTGPHVTTDAVALSLGSFVERLKKTPELISFSSVYEVLLKDNMSTLTAGLDSLWALLKGNMSLLLSILSTLLSLIFGGGMSVINFSLNLIVFVTALFYLLNTSRDLYKPVEFITKMSPKYGNKLALAVENACQEVLAASVKLAVFYGMWTWLIHSIFHTNIVYLPTVTAVLLGGIPVLGTYWVCLPAVLDLWLLQDNGISALLLLIAQILPTMIVDSTVYNEIQGGHPYLTGLAVAGGMFWLGMEGAVLGPLLLCFLYAILNIGSTIAHDPSTDKTDESPDELPSPLHTPKSI